MAEPLGPLVRRRPSLAAVLSLLWPGLGHWYNGDYVPALWITAVAVLGHALLWFVGMSFFVSLIVCRALLSIWYIGVPIHAALRAKRLGAVRVGRFQRVYVYILILLALHGGLSLLPAKRYRAFRIPSSAMEPTLLIGDFLIADTWRYRNEAPRRGDVLLFDSPTDGEIYIKRCVAVTGDTVEIRNKILYVNAAAQAEPYVLRSDPATHSPSQSPRDFMAPSVIPEGHFFVLGDNRDNSNDSRYWGSLPSARVRGQARYIYFSIDLTDGLWPLEIRWERLGRSIL